MSEAVSALEIPLHEPVAVVALALAVFLVAPLIFEWLRLPRGVAFIAAGALLGPNGLGWMARDGAIVLLGTVGLLYLMFIAAIELDLHDFSKHRTRSAYFGLLGFFLPLVAAVATGRYLGYSWSGAVLLGAMLSSYTLLAYPAVRRLGIAKNQAVMVGVGATIITDLLALLVLAGVAAGAGEGATVGYWIRLAGSLTLFALIVLRGLPRLAGWFFKQHADEGIREYTFILAALFGSSFLAQLAGVEPIVGAFLAGLALNPLLPEGQPLTNRLSFFSDALFTPFFLFSVGMLVDVGVLGSGPRPLAVLAGMAVILLPAKFLAAWLARRRYRYTWPETMTLFGLSVPQAAATLAIALIGYRTKLFDTAALNATIMIILITSTLGPWLVMRFGRRVAIAEQRQPFRGITEPQRILVPVGERGATDSLMELALLVRSPGSREPLLPVAVVEEGKPGVAARVAQAEKMLTHAIVRATGAGVRALPLTRVARDFAAGIARGIAESRATTVLLEWAARARSDWRPAVLTPELDRVVAGSDQLVMVTTLSGTVKTLERLVVILPPHVDRGPGFADAIRVVKLMASRLSAAVLFLVVDGSLDDIEPEVRRIRPRVDERFELVPDWPALYQRLAEGIGLDEMLTLLSERRGRVAWDRELDRMPRRLISVTSNLCVLYPCNIQPTEGDEHVLTLFREALEVDRTVIGLRGPGIRDAIHELMEVEFGADVSRLPEAITAVTAGLADDAREVAPGVVLLFGRQRDLAVPLLFLGTAPQGLEVPGIEKPARVIIAVLAPTAHPKVVDDYLWELEPLFASPARADEIARCTSVRCVAALFRPDDQASLSPRAA